MDAVWVRGRVLAVRTRVLAQPCHFLPWARNLLGGTLRGVAWISEGSWGPRVQVLGLPFLGRPEAQVNATLRKGSEQGVGEEGSAGQWWRPGLLWG